MTGWWKGLITRTRSATDRRTNHLDVTARGREVVQKIHPMLDRSDRRIVTPLSAADQKKFMELLTRLVQVNNSYSRAPLSHEKLDKLLAKRKSRTKKPVKT